jgi:hypothetical protein
VGFGGLWAEPASPPLSGELLAKLLVTPMQWRKCTHLSSLKSERMRRAHRCAERGAKGPLKSTLRLTPWIIDSVADRSAE